MPDLGEEMGDVEEERKEVISVVEENLSVFAEAIVEGAEVDYDADNNNVTVQITVDDETASQIEEEFDGVNVTNRHRETIRFNLQHGP